MWKSAEIIIVVAGPLDVQLKMSVIMTSNLSLPQTVQWKTSHSLNCIHFGHCNGMKLVLKRQVGSVKSMTSQEQNLWLAEILKYRDGTLIRLPWTINGIVSKPIEVFQLSSYRVLRFTFCWLNVYLSRHLEFQRVTSTRWWPPPSPPDSRTA